MKQVTQSNKLKQFSVTESVKDFHSPEPEIGCYTTIQKLPKRILHGVQESWREFVTNYQRIATRLLKETGYYFNHCQTYDKYLVMGLT